MTANPIMSRELKERMRALRTPVVLTAYLLLLGLIVFAAERAESREIEFGNVFASVTIGRTVFHFLLFFLLLFICFMVPAFTAGTVSSERERQTFHLIQVSMLKPSQIVLGKLGAAMSYLGLLILATIPLVSVSFVLGGVTPLDLVRGYAMVLFTGFTIAMISIAVSASFRRTMSSTVISFGLVLMLTIGTWIAFGLVSFLQTRNNFQVGIPEPVKPVWTVVLNPFVGTASAIQGRDTGGRASTPFEGLFSFLMWQPQAGFIGVDDGAIVEERLERERFLPAVPRAGIDDGWRMPVWGSTVIGYLVIAGLSYMVAVNNVRAPRGAIPAPRRPRRSLQEA